MRVSLQLTLILPEIAHEEKEHNAIVSAPRNNLRIPPHAKKRIFCVRHA